MKLEKLEKDCYYHIYNRGINSGLIFNNSNNMDYFLKLTYKYFEQKISILSYCLMVNHFHFVVKINGVEKEVIQLLSNLFNAYAKAFNKENSRTGSLFEKHFKRIKLNDEGYLKHLIIYVHLNPKHHLNNSFEDYKYSSYSLILSGIESNLNREEVLELFNGVENFIFCHKQRSELLSEKYTLE